MYIKAVTRHRLVPINNFWKISLFFSVQSEIDQETTQALNLESCYKAFGKSLQLNSNCILIAPVFGFEEVNSATCAKKFNSNWIIAQSDQTKSTASNLIIGTGS